MSEETKVKFCHKSIEGTVVSFAFGDGDTIVLDLNDIPEETVTDLALHGISQKGGDSYAGAGGDYAYAKEALNKVIENLLAGQFNAQRVGGGGKPKVGELATALAEIKSLEIEEATALVEAMDDDKRKAVRNHPTVKAKIAELRARKANEALAKASPEELEI